MRDISDCTQTITPHHTSASMPLKTHKSLQNDRKIIFIRFRDENAKISELKTETKSVTCHSPRKQCVHIHTVILFSLFLGSDSM